MRSRKQRREEIRSWRKKAAEIRRAHNLCLHEDEVKAYSSTEEARADTSPPVICPDCGLERLRVKGIHTPGYPPMREMAARLR